MAKKKPALQPPSDASISISAAPASTTYQEVVSTTTPSSTSNPPLSAPRNCLHCQLAAGDMSETEFQHHVANCASRPSTADGENATSLSTLSTPSLSSSHQTQSSMRDALGGVEKSPANLNPAVVTEVEDDARRPEFTEETLYPIRPYVNPETEFEYYQSSTASDGPLPEKEVTNLLNIPGNETSLAPSPESAEISSSAPSIELSGKLDGGQKPGPSRKYPFRKLTHPDVFEEYLANPEERTYEDLYNRTAKVSNCLVAWQEEWNNIEKQLLAHEATIKAEKGRAEAKAREEAESARVLDDQERDRVRDKYKDQLSLKGQDWTSFIEQVEYDDPDPIDTVRHLTNLRNPQFMAQVNKKRRPGLRNKEVRFAGVPLPELKPTKEEINFEKKKRGKLIDPIRFEDMKQADAYGFEYSAHNKHLGAQPLGTDNSRISQKKNAQLANGTDAAASEADAPGSSRTRGAPRNKVKKGYSESNADGTPDSDEEELPAKRAKKPKYLEDGSESTGVSRSQSRGATPSVKTFASGKRVGRPPAKSKLQAVQMAPKSPTPGHITREQSFAANPSQDLAPLQKAQLQQAAESLVNQTVSHKAEAAPVKKKHAGGRPKKSALAKKSAAADIAEASTSVPKPKNKGGRPKKNQGQAGMQSSVKIEAASHEGAVQLGEENGVLQSTEQNDGSQGQSGSNSSGRSKRKRTTAETDDSPLVVDSAPPQTIEHLAKKRRTRAVSRAISEAASLAASQAASLAPSQAPSQSTDQLDEDMSGDKYKRKHSTTSSAPTTESAGPSQGAEEGGNAKKRKAGGIKSGRAQKKVKSEFLDMNVDESTLDPEAREAYRKEKARVEKSQKLSESMKNRWARGGMKKAQETRLANNALKKAAKEAEASGVPSASNLAPTLAESSTPVPPPTAPTPPILPAAPALAPALAPKPVKSNILKLPLKGAQKAAGPKLESAPSVLAAGSPKKPAAKRAKPAPPPPRPASTRAKKPNKSFGFGYDGANDSDDGERSETQFASEYDRYQALTSPGNDVKLGKRVPKRKVDLSQYMENDEEEEEEEDFHSGEQTEGDDYSFES